MVFYINKSYLDTRLEPCLIKLNTPPARFSRTLPKDNTLAKLILSFEGKVPTAEDEPELFELADSVRNVSEEETVLEYADLKVILDTTNNDDEYRTKAANNIKDVEAFSSRE